jgi:hypothetical protein
MQFNLRVRQQNFCVVCFNFTWKSALQTAVFLSCAVAVGCIIIFEAHFLIMFALNIICSTGNDAIATLLNETHKWTSSSMIEEEAGGTLGEAEEDVWPANCKISSNSKDGAFQSFMGSICLTCGQFIIALYWMKYSTLTPVVLSNYAQSFDITASRKSSAISPIL